MISCVVLTYNEEENLARCLEALSWCDDVLVVDSFSTDGTLAVAAAHGARIMQRAFDDFANQRNFALDAGKLRHDWVLHVDADEVVTSELQREMLERIAHTKKSAFRVSSKLMFEGKFLRHAGLFPWYQVRLGRRDKLRFRQHGHGQREDLSAAEIETLRGSLLHYPFQKGLHEWVEKHNRYSSAEAIENVRRVSGTSVRWRDVFRADTDTRRRALKTIFNRLPFRPTARFIYMYLLRGGFLDGGPGLRYCKLLSLYERLIIFKEFELRKASRLKTDTVP